MIGFNPQDALSLKRGGPGQARKHQDHEQQTHGAFDNSDHAYPLGERGKNKKFSITIDNNHRY